ncbi:hypothetical protein OEZ85_006202 [Tetradesmus obliquus]|uniref:Uncharacterized protein n=2 Tax=Tetradesmus obliquus TaxID=3088 RepID=A0ABY8TXT8_TETOB|nr:hypothetical protein OEZ85_006202 [Tetradesmus obliquus]|eukprot:jgi/Sobl393_1/6244/SZX76997.1
MGDIIPVSNNALIAQDPEQAAAARAERIKEAQELEVKLAAINEADTRIFNVSGSCAGAGSGDFHYYRLIRRAEQDRLRKMDAEHKAQQERQQFEAKRQQVQTELEAKAAKKRAKRQKKKAKKKQKGAAGAAGTAGSDSEGSGEDSDAGKAAAAAVPEQQDLD